MAVLTNAQRVRARAALDRAYSAVRGPMPWLQSELDSEIGNLDSWQDLNQTLIATQFSVGFRAKATAVDLAVIFIAIAIARRLVAQPTHIAILRNILDQIEGIA